MKIQYLRIVEVMGVLKGIRPEVISVFSVFLLNLITNIPYISFRKPRNQENFCGK